MLTRLGMALHPKSTASEDGPYTTQSVRDFFRGIFQALLRRIVKSL